MRPESPDEGHSATGCHIIASVAFASHGIDIYTLCSSSAVDRAVPAIADTVAFVYDATPPVEYTETFQLGQSARVQVKHVMEAITIGSEGVRYENGCRI